LLLLQQFCRNMKANHEQKLDRRQQKLDGKYSERVQFPAKAIADCQNNGGARLMEQP